MIDSRIINVGIEIDGVLKKYDGLKIKASGTKRSNPTQNDCTITITNLKEETRDFLLSSVDKRNKKKAPRVTLEVGRKSIGSYVIFIGDIIGAESTPPPNIDVTIKCKTNNQNNAKIIVKSSELDLKLKDIAQECAQNNGLDLTFQAKDKTVAGYSFNGTASQQIVYLQRIGGVSCFVDDGVLLVTDKGAALSDRVKVLNIASGLVGIPTKTPKGAQIVFLIDAETKVGGVIRLQSKADKTINGDYRVNELKFDIDTHGDSFFYTAEAVRI